jgi:hypothetical protein
VRTSTRLLTMLCKARDNRLIIILTVNHTFYFVSINAMQNSVQVKSSCPIPTVHNCFYHTQCVIIRDPNIHPSSLTRAFFGKVGVALKGGQTRTKTQPQQIGHTLGSEIHFQANSCHCKPRQQL